MLNLNCWGKRGVEYKKKLCTGKKSSRIRGQILCLSISRVYWSQWNYVSKDFGPVLAFPRQSKHRCHSELKTFSNMNTSGCIIFARMEKTSSHCGSWPLSLSVSLSREKKPWSKTISSSQVCLQQNSLFIFKIQKWFQLAPQVGS